MCIEATYAAALLQTKKHAINSVEFLIDAIGRCLYTYICTCTCMYIYTYLVAYVFTHNYISVTAYITTH